MADETKNVPPEEQEEEKTTFKGFIMGLLAFTVVILIGVILVNTALVNLGLKDPKHGIVNQFLAILPFGHEEEVEEAPTFIETEANTALYQNTGSFGVFLGIDGTQAARASGYDLVVIDAQAFSAEDIAGLKANGATVLSYLNIGALEQWRPYYEEMSTYSLGSMEGWPDEVWMDVSNPDWQSYVANTLASQLCEKGIDGFFVDNSDVYAQYPTDEMYTGLLNIMNGLQNYNMPIILNGGNSFVSRGLSTGELTYLIEAVCQESVFTSYDPYKGYSFQSNANTEAYKDYLQSCADQNLLIYIIEYAPDPDTEAMILGYCRGHNFQYYIADSINLN